MDIDAFIDEIKKATSISILTGAGISTASGIPDFRGDDGFWKTNKPIYFKEFIHSEKKRIESWKNNIALTKKLSEITFNTGHTLVNKIISLYRDNILITQNIDGLHHKAGTKTEKIIEIHGTALRANCLECKKIFELQRFHTAIKFNKPVPDCDACNGLVKVATISFGQSMDPVKMQKAVHAVSQTDLLIVLGSSLVVQPVAGLPRIALENGKRLVICNKEPTPFDIHANLVMNGNIEDLANKILLSHVLD